MHNKFEFDDFKKFAEDMNKSEAEWEQIKIKCLQEISARLLRKAIKKTPVDTGNLRKSWVVGDIVKKGDSYVVEITNDAKRVQDGKEVFYGEYVEFGHRTADHKGWVDGQFFLTISETELRNEMDGIIKRKMKENGW